MKNRKFKIDIEEIQELLESFSFTSVGDPKEALSKMTYYIDEQYLQDRAYEIIHHYNSNEIFENLFSKLSSLCLDKKCSECPVKKYCNFYIAKQRSGIKKDTKKMIDLFCGAGGLSLGFSQEGFITSLANDIQECCIDTYAHNHPETPRKNIILGDIQDLIPNIQDLVNEVVDIVIGGPPCQGFSVANRQRIIDDPRNSLYKSFVDIVRIVKPQFVLMENVKGMLSVADQVVEDFNRIGYQVDYRVLNAKNYGVPQNRERLIYIGNRIGIPNNDVFDKIENLANEIPDFVLKDAIYGLKELEPLRIKNSTSFVSPTTGARIMPSTGKVNEYIEYINKSSDIKITFNHKSRYNNDRDIEIFGRLHPGDKSDDPKIEDIMPYKNRNHIFKDKYYKLDPDKVCKTITAHMRFDCNMYIHPYQPRGLTPREAARVQSYPDDYYFRGSFTKTYMQIGNSVPPLLGRSIAKIIKQYL